MCAAGYTNHNLKRLEMQQMILIKELIEQAAAASGGNTRLAKLLGVPYQHVTNWKNASRTCMPDDQARIAHIGGNDGIRTLIESTIERHAGTVRGDQLRQALER